MRRLLCAAALASSLVPEAWAQRGQQPNLVMTFYGGVVDGSSLWNLPKQPLCVLDAQGNCSQHDTLRLSRAVGTNITAGASVSYFPKPTLGFQGDIAYLGLPLEDGCAGVFYNNPDPTQQNVQICNSIQGESQTTGAVSFFGGVIARATPRRAASPYLRAGLGLVVYNHSTVEVAGAFVSSDSVVRVREIITDASPRRVSPSVLLGGGVTFPLGPSYQYRLEVRDVVVSFPRPTGPANALAQAPVGSRFFHHFVFTMGLDVVLEKKRGRRY